VPLNEATPEDVKNLKMGARRAKLTEAEVLRMLISGEAMLWRAEGPDCTGVVLVQELETDGVKELNIPLMAGKASLKYKEHMQKTLEEFGRLRGVKRITAEESKAVYRLVGKPLGYKIDKYMISKEL